MRQKGVYFQEHFTTAAAVPALGYIVRGPSGRGEKD